MNKLRLMMEKRKWQRIGHAPKHKLLPCPFCGKEAAEFATAHDLEACGNFDNEDVCPCEYLSDPDEEQCQCVTVVCSVWRGGCGATCGFIGGTTKEAADKWNGRALNVTARV